MPRLYKIQTNGKYACYTFMSDLVATLSKTDYPVYNTKKVVRCCDNMPKLAVTPNCIPKYPPVGRRSSHYCR